ncbi:DUF4307 domain-containing protein [Kitasatospora sp. NPDC047058]|uniref:DUF4307 domain-containing protein n=1 Tax=Kitasatospora sp. NPDC047058 TaxID=3155620 RepID=UPI0033FD8F5E
MSERAATTAPQPPEGRYGRRSDREADRRLKVIGAVCGVLGLGVLAWLGGSYLLRETTINGTVPSFEAVSDGELKLHLAVRKSDGTAGTCTVRSQGENGAVVGMADFPVPKDGSSYDAVVSLRTTTRGTTAELLGCTPAE